MLTIRADILKEKPKKDGSFNIRIRFTHNRKVKRLPTKLYVRKEDLTRSFDFGKAAVVCPPRAKFY